MFVDKQMQVLKYDIEPSRIKSRSKGNINLSYLEGFDKAYFVVKWGVAISTSHILRVLIV